MVSFHAKTQCTAAALPHLIAHALSHIEYLQTNECAVQALLRVRVGTVDLETVATGCYSEVEVARSRSPKSPARPGNLSLVSM